MVPALIEMAGAPWKVLPPGVHQASLVEVGKCFATNAHRRDMFDGLMSAAEALAHAGVQYLYLDGSFVTGKPLPGDYDSCWDPAGVVRNRLDKVFLDFGNGRANQKAKYKGEFFPFNCNAVAGQMFIDFFQIEKHAGKKKGIVLIDLSSESFGSVKEVPL